MSSVSGLFDNTADDDRSNVNENGTAEDDAQSTVRRMNVATTSKVKDIFHGTDTVHDQGDHVSDGIYNGIEMEVDTAKVFVHILDEFEDHFGRASDPNLTMKLDTFTDLGDDDNYKSKDDGPGSKFNTSVTCLYNIGGDEVESDYFAIDNVLFEMYPALTKDGNLAKNHGTSWMNVYFTQAGLIQFCRKFEADTGWGLKSSMFTADGRQKLASLRVSMDEDNPPSWVTMVLPDSDNEGNDDDEEDEEDYEIQLNNWGDMSVIFGNPEAHGLYRGTGIFTTNFNVVSVDGTVDNLSLIRDQARTAGVPLYGRISVSLVGVRILEKTDRYKKITLGKRKGIRNL